MKTQADNPVGVLSATRIKIAAALMYVGYLILVLSLLNILIGIFDFKNSNFKVWLVATALGFLCVQIGATLVKKVPPAV